MNKTGEYYVKEGENMKKEKNLIINVQYLNEPSQLAVENFNKTIFNLISQKSTIDKIG